MKFSRYFSFVCILAIACIFTVGCEKMEKPVMDAVDMAMTDTETPAEMDGPQQPPEEDTQQPETPPQMDGPQQPPEEDTQQPETPPQMDGPQQPPDPPEIDDDGMPIEMEDGEETPTLPADFEILPDDNVVHVTELSPGPQVYLNDAGELDIKGEPHVYDTLIFDNYSEAWESYIGGDMSYFFQWWIDTQGLEHCKGGNVVDTGGMTVYFRHPGRDSRNGIFRDTLLFRSGTWEGSKSVVILNNAEVYYAFSVNINLNALDDFCDN